MSQSKEPTQEQLNLYGVIFIYRPYQNYWEAFYSSADYIKSEAGKDIGYTTLKSESITQLVEYIHKNGYKKEY